MPCPLPAYTELARDLKYNPKTGEFFWLRQDQGRKLDRPAGCAVRGRRLIGFGGRIYYASRLAYLLMTGQDPGKMDIDHINGDPSDDRWSNLRAVPRSINLMNRRPYHQQKTPVENWTGFKGVYMRPTKTGIPRYYAIVRYKDKLRYLGVHDTPEEANAAVQKHYEESGLSHFQPQQGEDRVTA